ncbi:MAG: hypothetical protein IV100_24735 [Myxococcales bacterium]|nr:hypothetical protein [Myxococcales bacterium]
MPPRPPSRLRSRLAAPFLAIGWSALALGAGCKKSEPAPTPAPVPAATPVASPAPAASPAPNTLDVARAAELLAKYEKLADKACACEAADCYQPIKVAAQAQVKVDKALSLNDADRSSMRAALVRLYQCEPGADAGKPTAAAEAVEEVLEADAGEGEAEPSAEGEAVAEAAAAAPTPTPAVAAAPAEAEEAEEAGEEEAEEAGEEPAEEGEAEEGEAEEGEAVEAPTEAAAAPAAAEAAPAEPAPTGAPGTITEAWFNQVAGVPYGDEFVDFFEKQGVTSAGQVWGKSLETISSKYPDAAETEIQDVRPYFSSFIQETESTNDSDKTVVLVAGFYENQLFQLSLKLQKSEADMKDQLAEKLGREWDRVIDDGYQVKGYVWDLPGHIVKVREKGPYRTIVIADAARAAKFAEADADAVQAEIANTKGLELMTRFPRTPNSRAALAKFNEALGLVEGYGHAQVNLCNLHWTAWGDYDAARRACKAALDSRESDVRAEATLYLGLIANATGDTGAGRTLLSQAAAMETEDGYAPARAKKHLAFMRGSANRSQFLSLLDDLVCAAAENDTERGERLMASLGAPEDAIQAMANGLGITADDMLARDKGRCVSRSGQTW